MPALRYVNVNLSVILRSGQVFSIDQALDSFLDQYWVRRESGFQLFGHFGYQIQMRQFLSRFHYAYNCSLNLVFAGISEVVKKF